MRDDLEVDEMLTDVEAEESNVFRVLGAQARTRTVAQLWMAAIGGAVDAGLLWWRHPMLGWLAAGCAAVAAYGIWGLLDRGIERRTGDPAAPDDLRARLSGLRDLTAIAGTVAALWAVLSFMAVALGNWNH
ncbi:MAG TPA: hypothetical protein VJW73_15170 [Gemmatimonadaceae bacterium]|nr:hypothetical protein [Gemmatimonadaceae bacterium]